MLINITIWNQPLVQYQMPKRPTTHNQSIPDPSIAVQYALIGVYNKLIHSPKFSCQFSNFNNSIVSVL